MNGQASAVPEFCVIIPAFNEAGRFEPVVRGAREQAPCVVVVDDGSSDDTAGVAQSLGAVVLRHERNLGKGASLLTGFGYARDNGIPVVMTMDADGQHAPDEIRLFIEAYRRTRIPVIVGNRLWTKRAMPPMRTLANRLMTCILNRTMKNYLPDTQCGFRLYRTDILPFVRTESQRFAMESEILLYLAMRGFRMDSVRISTVYKGIRSRINPVVDAFRFVSMLLRYHHIRKVIRAGG